MIDRESLAALVTIVKEAVDAHGKSAENKGNPTVFEVETMALSFLYLRKEM